ncbi:MAG: hypothetical protein ABR961_03335 [Thermoanaerobaculaceae bacterium]|jgi:hypothetical protein
MRVKIVEPTSANGHPVHVGEVLETDDRSGHLLIGLGKAVRVEASGLTSAAPAEAPEVETATDKAAESAVEEGQRRTRFRPGGRR